MNLVGMFVLGLLTGWLVEWVIDWFYWRSRHYRLASENAHFRERITSLESEQRKWPAAPQATALTEDQGRDNLQAIKGVGPVFAKRLNEGGVYTFEQLSRLTPGQLEEILGELFKRFFSKQETILAQARELAQQKSQRG